MQAGVRGRRMRDALCGLAVLALVAGAARAEELPPPEFRLAPGDEIAVSVFANDALSGRFPVRPDGTVAMHLIGALPARGSTPAEFEGMLRLRLTPIVQEPISTTVTVARWRPVAVTGAVAQPGLYEFSDGLDVMRATALAGGVSRLAADTPMTLALRVTEETGRYQGLKSRLAGLVMEESRLLQERAGAEDVPVPPEVVQLVGQEGAAQLAQEQLHLMQVRRNIHSIRTSGEQEREKLALTEAQFFAERRVLSERQVEVTERDLSTQKTLQEQGLSIASRLLQVSLAVEQYRSNALEAAAYEIGAKQDAGTAANTARGLIDQREEEITQRLAEVRQSITETRATLAASRAILSEFGGGAGLSDAATPPRYVVVRRVNGVAKSYTVEPFSLLQPGDTVEVVPAAPGDVQ